VFMVSFIDSFSAYSQKADTKPSDTQWRAENKRVRLTVHNWVPYVWKTSNFSVF
jgi:hypothetical protein